jgi:hypothetical protein
MVTVWAAVTGLVVMLKPGDTDWPAAIVTKAGTTTAGSLLVSCTTTPEAGAMPLRLTLAPFAVVEPTRELAGSLMEDNTGGVTVRVACLLAPLYVAVMVTAVCTGTAVVAMAN